MALYGYTCGTRREQMTWEGESVEAQCRRGTVHATVRSLASTRRRVQKDAADQSIGTSGSIHQWARGGVVAGRASGSWWDLRDGVLCCQGAEGGAGVRAEQLHHWCQGAHRGEARHHRGSCGGAQAVVSGSLAQPSPVWCCDSSCREGRVSPCHHAPGIGGQHCGCRGTPHPAMCQTLTESLRWSTLLCWELSLSGSCVT